MERLRKVTATLLDARSPVASLRPEVLELAGILSAAQGAAQGAPTTAGDDIGAGETRTPHGIALSPKMAEMCAEDFVRTIRFLRGTRAAIADARERFPDRPARVLYVGCGPFATLCVPLMTVLSPDQATFTLLDIHAESIRSARSVVGALGLAESVTAFEETDAGSYRVSAGEPPDVILLEIMRACLESEPQVAITRHLLEQAPDALLVPEEVRIDLALVDPAREFDLDAVQKNRATATRDRIPVATVFTLDRESVRAWRGDGDGEGESERLGAARVRMPDSVEPRYQPMLFTIVRVYGDHVLRDYDSGLTCPRVLSVAGTVGPGATIEFHYQLGPHPQLRAQVCG